MREIKFRFWCPYTKRMKGSLSLYEIKNDYNIPAQCFDHAMQYTGLKDKNGIEIYEGDIINTKVRFEEMSNFIPGAVYWDSIDTGFEVRFPNADVNSGPFLSEYDSPEVVGNIYENPELLEKPNE